MMIAVFCFILSLAIFQALSFLRQPVMLQFHQFSLNVMPYKGFISVLSPSCPRENHPEKLCLLLRIILHNYTHLRISIRDCSLVLIPSVGLETV